MTAGTEYAPYDPSLLPPVVTRYLDDHADAAHRDAVVALFAEDARVVDDGTEHRGIDAIRAWLAREASAYAFTVTPIGQRSEGDDRWVVLVRLEGTFPGGVVDLRYRAAVRDGRIADLVIAV